MNFFETSIGTVRDLRLPEIGGLASHVRFGRIDDGRPVVVKRPGTYSGAVEQLAHEARLLTALDGRLGAPRLLACDDTMLVLEQLPGRIDLAAHGSGVWRAYAQRLVEIHLLPPASVGVALPAWESWVDSDVQPPTWSGEAGLWHQAIARSRLGAPGYAAVFCHHDYHPGNLLVAAPADGCNATAHAVPSAAATAGNPCRRPRTPRPRPAVPRPTPAGPA